MNFPGNARNWGFYRISPLNHCPIFCECFISYVKQWLKATGLPLLCLEERVSAYSSKRTSLMGCREGQISAYGLVMLAVQIWLLSHTGKIEFDSQVIRPEWISLIFQPDRLIQAIRSHYTCRERAPLSKFLFAQRSTCKTNIQFGLKDGPD